MRIGYFYQKGTLGNLKCAGRHSDQPKLSNKEFRNASIITALNVQKDRINELGSVHLAVETGQILFY